MTKKLPRVVDQQVVTGPLNSEYHFGSQSRPSLPDRCREDRSRSLILYRPLSHSTKIKLEKNSI